MPRASRRKAPLLVFDTLSPMLLEQARAPFDDAGWTWELKYDGYRLLAWAAPGETPRLRTRNGADASRWFPEVGQALRDLMAGKKGPVILDGEVCVLDELGRTDFERLHGRARRRGYRQGDPRVVYAVFDVLEAGGASLIEKPLSTRQVELAQLLESAPARLMRVTGMEGRGRWLYEQAKAHELEGVVGKRLDSLYEPGVRSDAWVKVKRPGATPAQRFRH